MINVEDKNIPKRNKENKTSHFPVDFRYAESGLIVLGLKIAVIKNKPKTMLSTVTDSPTVLRMSSGVTKKDSRTTVCMVGWLRKGCRSYNKETNSARWR